MSDETRQIAEGHHIAQAGPGGYASIVDARTTIIGLSPEQVRTCMLEVLREESTAQAKVEELSHKLNVTHEAVVGFLKILNRSEVPLEKLPETLAVIAQRYQEMLDRLAILNPEDPTTKALIKEARIAIEAGNYDRADVLLHQAEVAELAAARQAQALAQQAQAAAEQRLLNAAATRAERGEISLTRLNYPEAAAHFKAASEMVPLSHSQIRGEYLGRQANALFEYGEQKGDNTALRQAITVYQKALGVLTRERTPLDWAMTQNNLGSALTSLGERKGSTKPLR